MSKNFDEMNSKGKLGEEVIANFLSSLGYSILDVSNMKEYQHQDIDFLIDSNITLEVKTDFQISKTGNLLFEDVFFQEYGNIEGWLHYCKADYLVFYDVESKTAYWLDGAVMREVVPHRSDYRIYSSPGDGCRKGCYLMDLATALSCRTPGKLVIGKTLI